VRMGARGGSFLFRALWEAQQGETERSKLKKKKLHGWMRVGRLEWGSAE